MISGEIWRPVPSAPELLVSSEGRIMVKPYTAKMPYGGERVYGGEPHFGVWSKTDARFIYTYKGHTFKVARLICEAFNGAPPNDDSVVMHLDENSANNRPKNLQWGTQKENLSAPGFRAYAQRRGKAAPKISPDDARRIKYGYGSCADLAAQYNISPSTVSNIRAGRSWRHV